MSAFDPRLLEKHAPKAEITSDRACPKCGYNLKGLKVGMRCPECGQPIAAGGGRRFGEAITEAPLGYLRRLAGATLGLAGAAWACTLLFVAGWWSVLGAVAGTLAALGWVWGVWAVTRPRAVGPATSIDPRREWAKARWLARAGAFAWVAAGVLLIVDHQFRGGLGWQPVAARVAYLLVSGAALVAMLPLAAVLSDLCEWANEDGLAQRFRGVAWVLGAMGGYMALTGPSIPVAGAAKGLLWVLWCLALVLMLLAMPVFLWSLLQLANMCRWAVRNAEGELAKHERRAAREAAAHAARNERGSGSAGVDGP